jgi:DNA-binding transcriptional LysR family regulator
MYKIGFHSIQIIENRLKHMPYVESIKVFVRVVELGSITAAGRDQRLTPAVASNRIKELERRLGVRLFNRTTRKLALTETGRVFFDHANKVIEAVENAEAAVAGFAGKPRGVVRALAPLGLGRRIIGPLIPAFSEQYPEIEVRLRLTDRKTDFLSEGADVAFVLGALEDSNMKLKTVMTCERVLVASRTYLDKNGVPAEPSDLSSDQHNCLLLRFPGSQEYYWMLMIDGLAVKTFVKGRYDVDDGDLLTSWALDGRGIANRPRYEVAAHLRSGDLIEVLPNTPPENVRFGCLYPHRRLQDPKVRLFMEFISDGAKDEILRILDDAA